MPAALAAVLVIGVISACVSSLYYCRLPTQNHDIENNKNQSEDEVAPFVRIKISRPRRNKEGCTAYSEYRENQRHEHNFTDTEVHRKVENVHDSNEPDLEKSENISSRPSCNRYPDQSMCNCQQIDRSSKSIWSPTMRNQLNSITNSSSETCDTIKVVRAQVEVYPCCSASSEDGTRDPVGHESLSDKVNPEEASSNEIRSSNEGVKRRFSVVKKWRHFKKSIRCPRPNRSIAIKEVEHEETDKLSIPVQASLEQSPVEHSARLHKNRFVDVSTSTKISSHNFDQKNKSNEIFRDNSGGSSTNLRTVSLESTKSREIGQESHMEVLHDVFSLIKQDRSVDGKSLYDVRISGLAMNQAELLDLFETAGGKSKSTSVVTTEEASIISIKFQPGHRKSSDPEIKENVAFSENVPTRTLYKSLPERLSDIMFLKWFRSQQRPSSGQRSPFLHIPERVYSSPNETSYFGFPKIRSSIRRQDSLFEEKRNVPGGLTQRSFARFFQEQQLERSSRIK